MIFPATKTVQQLENVGLALSYLEGKGIKLGIDAAGDLFIITHTNKQMLNFIYIDVVDGNLKMILSLIWALIFHYQLQVWVDVRDKQTAKGSLLNWVREAVVTSDVSFTTMNVVFQYHHFSLTLL